MSTRSTIALELTDGRVLSVYCHFDGYYEHNGKILKEYYSDYDKVLELVQLGSMSSLQETIEDTVFYKRDRGEEKMYISYFSDFNDYIQNNDKQEYNYIFRDGKWTYTR